MRDALDGVDVFVAAAEAGGFARAGDRLSLTRSAVGKAIARLEARLGVRLFHRTTRSQSLTEDGQLYLERCLRALEELRQGEAALASGQREVGGRLKVTMPALFGRHCVAPVLLDLAREHPALELDLRFGDALVDLVADGYDLAVRNGSPGDRGGLRTRKIAVQTKVVCASPSYLEARGRPAIAGDLAHHDALVYRWNDEPYPWTLREPDGGKVDVPLAWRHQFDDYEAIADAAMHGLGIACLPSWLVRPAIAAGRLVPLLEAFSSPPLDTYAVWPDTRFVPMRLRVAIDVIAERLPPMIAG